MAEERNQDSNRGMGSMNEGDTSRQSEASSERMEGNTGERRQNSSTRGFAAMDPAEQKRIASEGGRAAHQQGVAHEWSREEAREAGRKGGEAVSRNREHMSEIGRKGGLKSGGNRRNR